MTSDAPFPLALTSADDVQMLMRALDKAAEAYADRATGYAKHEHGHWRDLGLRSQCLRLKGEVWEQTKHRLV